MVHEHNFLASFTLAKFQGFGVELINSFYINFKIMI
ncbi:hypothetical protein SLEP1_g52135 [Rubroshorea leprosula]|uniref:Uncharacterized protein n=1 Tax=Rubroshorea leprosula TaxID=152421 RepID=A0AAV5M653_9ROSI|nr:hypothetical protein SLEP1_g52135 [Rubroshorea leprosula]